MTVVGRPPRHSAEERRELIFNSAFDCLLQYGYSKTSLEDIAQGAGISRSLLYQHFRNKEDLVRSMAESMMNSKLKRISQVVAEEGDLKEKTLTCLKIWLVEIYDKLQQSKHGDELFHVGEELLSDLKIEKNNQVKKLLTELTGDPGVAELLVFSSLGLKIDKPSRQLFLNRLKLLVKKVLK